VTPAVSAAIGFGQQFPERCFVFLFLQGFRAFLPLDRKAESRSRREPALPPFRSFDSCGSLQTDLRHRAATKVRRGLSLDPHFDGQ
jgi:hypothetical protein